MYVAGSLNDKSAQIAIDYGYHMLQISKSLTTRCAQSRTLHPPTKKSCKWIERTLVPSDGCVDMGVQKQTNTCNFWIKNGFHGQFQPKIASLTTVISSECIWNNGHVDLEILKRDSDLRLNCTIFWRWTGDTSCLVVWCANKWKLEIGWHAIFR
jgi:hypothetical protein